MGYKLNSSGFFFPVLHIGRAQVGLRAEVILKCGQAKSGIFLRKEKKKEGNYNKKKVIEQEPGWH